jgi:hypothetical protein
MCREINRFLVERLIFIAALNAVRNTETLIAMNDGADPVERLQSNPASGAFL